MGIDVAHVYSAACMMDSATRCACMVSHRLLLLVCLWPCHNIGWGHSVMRGVPPRLRGAPHMHTLQVRRRGQDMGTEAQSAQRQ